ncbi:MAG: hypothetical protein E7397_02665 [Ruminococcaceae bacterium]|nr:hypothetical protein [Oscillospiraceae bacterium]
MIFLYKKLSDYKLHEKLLPASEFSLFSSMPKTDLANIDSDLASAIIREADSFLTQEIPILPASLYMQFCKDGNRINFEKIYFHRRNSLKTLLVAEQITKSKKYIEKIIDYTWAILEETGWSLPAHNWVRDRDDSSGIFANLPNCYQNAPWFVDLFSAETGAILAMVYFYMKDAFCEENAQILVERLRYELDRHVLTPFLATDNMWWMGLMGNFVNNWNPWIISNILTITAIIETNDVRRSELVEKSCRCLDCFTSFYPEDGGCNEGSVYWFEAGACLFDSLELLDEMTGGCPELFQNPLYNNIMSYIQKVHINDLYFITYGDAHPRHVQDGKLYRRIGRRFQNPVMAGFGQEMCTRYRDFSPETRASNPSRFIRNLIDNEDMSISYTPDLISALPDTQLCAMRQTQNPQKGFYVWVKGGHNDESHNHNDLGSVGLYVDGEPCLIDLGVGTYTKFTFSDMRYTLFPIRSCDHNIPLIHGAGQHEGADYHTDFFEIDEKNRTIRVGLKNAYENKDEMESFVRTVQLTDTKLILTDTITTKTAGEIVTNFYFLQQPEIVTAGTISLQNGLSMTYSPDVEASVETIVFEEDGLKTDWNTDCVYRLSFRTIKDTCNTNTTYQIFKTI